jgi:hypothetical protein
MWSFCLLAGWTSLFFSGPLWLVSALTTKTCAYLLTSGNSTGLHSALILVMCPLQPIILQQSRIRQRFRVQVSRLLLEHRWARACRYIFVTSGILLPLRYITLKFQGTIFHIPPYLITWCTRIFGVQLFRQTWAIVLQENVVLNSCSNKVDHIVVDFSL